jgi:hypothetical protein
VTAHMTPVGGRNSVRRSATTAGYGGLNDLKSPGLHRRSLMGAQNSARTMTPMSALTTPRSMPGSADGNGNGNGNGNGSGSGGSMLASDDFSVSSATTAGTSPMRSGSPRL